MIRRVLSTLLPTVEADAFCGGCVARKAHPRCCRPNYREYGYYDRCGDLCSTTCVYEPSFCQ